MNSINSVTASIEQMYKGVSTTKVTNDYAWARITDDILNKINIGELKRDYFVKFMDWTEIPHNAWASTPGNDDQPDPYLIWCQKVEIHEHCASGVAVRTKVLYRPVKKTDIPVASFE